MESPGSPPEPQRRAFADGMARRPGEGWARFAERVADAFGLVLLLVVLNYALASLLPYRDWNAVLIALTACLCATVALVSAGARPTLARGAALFGVGAVACAVVTAVGGGRTFAGIAAIISAVLLAVGALEVLGTVLTEHEVGFKSILGAISVYVMIGLLFTFVYAGIDRVQTGAFFQQPTQTGDFAYFSITTLTTTGYGNLIPAAQPGRMLSGLEMLVGQIFLVTLIAGLVSLWRPGMGRARRSDKR